MTLTETTVQWMFLAIVLLAALAIVTNYAIVRVVLTGRAWAFERKRERGGANVVDWTGSER